MQVNLPIRPMLHVILVQGRQQQINQVSHKPTSEWRVSMCCSLYCMQNSKQSLIVEPAPEEPAALGCKSTVHIVVFTQMSVSHRDIHQYNYYRVSGIAMASTEKT